MLFSVASKQYFPHDIKGAILNFYNLSSISQPNASASGVSFFSTGQLLAMGTLFCDGSKSHVEMLPLQIGGDAGLLWNLLICSIFLLDYVLYSPNFETVRYVQSGK